MKTFGERLRDLRKEKDLTGEQLGAIFNVTKTAVSNWENGNRFPDENTLRKMAEFFNVSIDYLLGRTNIRNLYEYNNFSKKDEKEIEKYIEHMKKSLEQNEGLMLSGEPVSPEAIESIIEALEYGYRQAKKINKKYTPKKYRKDEDHDR